MDPYSRRQTWDVLLSHRKGRVIVLTTHFMDEADILSDRIAILSDGHLRCIGTSLFLKALFGLGYRLRITINDGQHSSMASDDLHELVSSHIPTCKLIYRGGDGHDLMFQLPLQEASSFPALLRSLDAYQERIEYGISATTLEDVFLAVAQQRDTGDVVDISSRAVVRPKSSINYDDPLAAKHRRRKSSAVAVQLDRKSTQPTPRMSTTTKKPPHRRRRRRPFMGRVLFQMVLKRWWLFKRDVRQPVFLMLLPLLFLLVPVVIPEVEVVSLLRPGVASHPIPGPIQCDPDLAMDSKTSCASNPSSCLAQQGDDVVQVLPQFLNVEDLAKKCTLHKYMGFCKYVPWMCSTDICCNWRDHRSPWYPCQTSQMLPPKVGSGDDDANWNVHCPRRQYAMIQGVVNGFVKAMAVLMAFIFTPAVIIAHAVLETEATRNTKFQQVVSGVRLSTYWMGAFLWDQASFAPAVLLAMMLMGLYSYPLGSVAYLPALILIVLFAVASVPLAYCLSLRFRLSSRALTAMLVVNIVTGAGLGIVNYILQTVEVAIPGTSMTTRTFSDGARYVLMAAPGFSLIDGLLRLQNQLYTICVGDPNDPCIDGIPSFDTDIWKNALYMAIVAVLAWLALIYAEAQNLIRDEVIDEQQSSWRLRLLKLVCGAPTNAAPFVSAPLADADVVAEKRAVLSMLTARDPVVDPLVVAGMAKVYPSGVTALQPLYLKVPTGQCLGFLGINGAGKTTTIKCLTGAIMPSSGTAFVDGYNITSDMYGARSRAGYCPQFDALFDLLTVAEHLVMYTRIRGLALDGVPDVIASMQLTEFRQVPARLLSGGNRRKLSAAIALLGRPRVVYLDEPSTGMDPHAKRFLWRHINEVIGRGETAAMLTTHSMEECEALCSRVAILMGGRLVGIGSIPHLKTRFGSGYTIEVRTTTVSAAMIAAGRRLLSPDVAVVGRETLPGVCQQLGNPARADQLLLSSPFVNDEQVPIRLFLQSWIEEQMALLVVEFMARELPEVRLTSKHGPHMLFTIVTSGRIALADLFSILARGDAIEHYAISQTSLEEIFNAFAHQHQRGALRRRSSQDT